MMHFINRVIGSVLFLFGITFAVVLLATFPHESAAQITATSTVSVMVEKKFSGTQEGYTESDFSFHISGNGINETIPHAGSIDLMVGTYTIEEIVPDDFITENWRIGWYGACESGDDLVTTIIIDESNIDHGTLSCQADNQYRPENNTSTTTNTVALQLEKKFSGTQEGFTIDQFAFQISGNGVNEIIPHNGLINLHMGTYSIEEITPDGFVQADWRIQWSGACEDNDTNQYDSSIVIDQGNIIHGTVQCRADNQFRPNDNDGDDGSEDDDSDNNEDDGEDDNNGGDGGDDNDDNGDEDGDGNGDGDSDGGNGDGDGDGDDTDNNGDGGSNGSSGSSGSSGNNPDGRVAGQQTTVVPAGAARTGAGGTAPSIPSIPYSVFAIMLAAFALRRLNP